MSTSIDQAYYWQGFGNGVGLWESKCRLRIFQPHPEITVPLAQRKLFVLVSDLGADCGTSITNCADHLATLIVTEFQLDPDALTWIGHLPASEASFSRVEFDWLRSVASGRVKLTAARPRWSYLTSDQVEALSEQSLRETKPSA